MFGLKITLGDRLLISGASKLSNLLSIALLGWKARPTVLLGLDKGEV